MGWGNEVHLIKALLASCEEEERAMQCNLEMLSKSGQRHAYQTYLRTCIQTRRQIARRRQLLKDWPKETQD